MPQNYKRKVGPSQQFKYSPESMRNAISAYKQNKGTLRKIAERFNVPKSTLSEKVRGVRKNKHGGQPALQPDQEESLAAGLIKLAEWGFPLRSRDVRDVVQSHLNRIGSRSKIFKDNRPGRDWMTRFFKRHQSLVLRMSQNIKRSRAEIDADTINEYFDNLEVSLAGLPPANIINYDETNFTDDPGNERVIVKRGTRHAERIIDSSKTSTSVMCAFAADGIALPPYVVYKSTYVYDTWTENGIAGAVYMSSKSGWFDMNLFEDWFVRIILPYRKKIVGRMALIGDNLASHVSRNVVEMCEKNDILFILLPPNSTHLTQPADVGVFSPTKKSYRYELGMWKKRNRGVLPKSEFPAMLKRTFEGIPNLAANIKSAFRGCGIVPINRFEVLKRLPGYSQSPEEESVTMNDTLVDFLKTMRSSETAKSTRKKKKISVTPGKVIQLENIPTPPAPKKTKKSKTKPKDPVEEAIRIVDESDTEPADIPVDIHFESNSEKEDDSVADWDSDDQSQSEEEIQDEEENRDLVLREKDYILVKFVTEEDKRDRYFAGYLANILDKNESQFEVQFLRKRVTKKEMYFVYPDVPDVDNVNREQVFSKLELSAERRGRLFFRSFPKIDSNLIS